MSDWKPIEKLKTEILKDGDLLVLFGRFDSIVSVGTDDYGNPSYMFDNQFLTDVDDLEDILIEHKYTHYSILTPPNKKQINHEH